MARDRKIHLMAADKTAWCGRDIWRAFLTPRLDGVTCQDCAAAVTSEETR